jgi:hypothetical protein
LAPPGAGELALVDLGDEGLDGGERGRDGRAQLLGRGQLGRAEPVVADHALFVGIGEPSGSSTKAITVVPCFIGPASRTTLPPRALIAAQAAWASGTASAT